MSESKAEAVLQHHQQLARRLLVQLGELQETLSTQPIELSQPVDGAPVAAEQRERLMSLARRMDDLENLKQLCDLAEQLQAKQVAS
jgi:hypothetical protein